MCCATCFFIPFYLLYLWKYYKRSGGRTELPVVYTYRYDSEVLSSDSEWEYLKKLPTLLAEMCNKTQKRLLRVRIPPTTLTFDMIKKNTIYQP